MTSSGIKISSDLVFSRRILPILFYCLMAVELIVIICNYNKVPLFLIVHPFFMSALFVIIHKKIIMVLANDIYLSDEEITVVNAAGNAVVKLQELISVHECYFQNPPKVTLAFKEKHSFGDTISFSPILEFSYFKFKSSNIDRLKEITSKNTKVD